MRQADGFGKPTLMSTTSNGYPIPAVCLVLVLSVAGVMKEESFKDGFAKGQHGRERCLHRELTPFTKYLGEGARWSLLMAVLVFCSLAA